MYFQCDKIDLQSSLDEVQAIPDDQPYELTDDRDLNIPDDQQGHDIHVPDDQVDLDVPDDQEERNVSAIIFNYQNIM